MGVEAVETIPDIPERLHLKYREIVDIVSNSASGKTYKFTTEEDDNKKVNAPSLRLLLEKRTKKTLKVVRYDTHTAYISVLSGEEVKKELSDRQRRAAEMKKRLQGKGRG